MLKENDDGARKGGEKSEWKNVVNSIEGGRSAGRDMNISEKSQVRVGLNAVGTTPSREKKKKIPGYTAKGATEKKKT